MSRCGAVRRTQSERKSQAPFSLSFQVPAAAFHWSQCKPVPYILPLVTVLELCALKVKEQSPAYHLLHASVQKPKNLSAINSLIDWRGFLSWNRLAYFLRAFFSSSHRHVKCHVMHIDVTTCYLFHKCPMSSLLQHPRLTPEAWK